MKKNILKIVTVTFVLSLVFSSCATKKKYGCPNHINIQKLLGL